MKAAVTFLCLCWCTVSAFIDFSLTDKISLSQFNMRKVHVRALSKLKSNLVDCYALCIARGQSCLGIRKSEECYYLSSASSGAGDETVNSPGTALFFRRRDIEIISGCPAKAKWSFTSDTSLHSVYFVEREFSWCAQGGGRPAAITSALELQHVQKIQAELGQILVIGAVVRVSQKTNISFWAWKSGARNINRTYELWANSRMPPAIPGLYGAVNGSDVGLIAIEKSNENVLCECNPLFWRGL